MSNEVTVYSALTQDELMKLTGQETGSTFIDLPRLTINKDVGEDEDKPLPVGSFCVSQNGLQVFGKPILFRPFINSYQYRVYDPEIKAMVNKSIIFKSFGDEALDELGGIACGKVPNKDKDQLTKEQLAEQKKITCYRILYGLATFEGVTSDKTEVSIVDTPVKFSLRGDNFMPIQDSLNMLAKKKIPMLTVNFNLSLERKKNGTNVWYRVGYKPNMDSFVQLGEPDWEALATFQESIDKENSVVVAKHKEAHKDDRQEENSKEVAAGLELPDDEIPF